MSFSQFRAGDVKSNEFSKEMIDFRPPKVKFFHFSRPHCTLSIFMLIFSLIILKRLDVVPKIECSRRSEDTINVFGENCYGVLKTAREEVQVRI